METVQTETRSCRRCDAPMEVGTRFCQHCGAPAVSAAGRPCSRCGAALGATARFCSRCGARTPISAAATGGGWLERVRSRLPAGSRTRVGWIALPAAALLLTATAGYWLGQRSARPHAPEQPVVTATRGWREVMPAERPGERSRGQEAGDAAGSEPDHGPDSDSNPAATGSSSPTRFRDFAITASSWEYAHPPALAADGDPYTFWHAWKTERYATGDWLTLTFPEERVISRIGLLPGRVGPRARAEGRVRSLLVKAPGAAPQKLIFADHPSLQRRNLAQPVRTRKLILRIATVLPGRASNHIVVPEVQVWGHR